MTVDTNRKIGAQSSTMGDKADIEEDGCQADVSLPSFDSGYNSKSLPPDAGCLPSLGKPKTEVASPQTTCISEELTNLNLEKKRSEQTAVPKLEPKKGHIEKGKTGRAKSVITNEVIEMFEGDDDGDNQLHISIIQCLLPITFYIIDQAPTRYWLDLPNKLLQTPLHLAVLIRSIDLIKVLVRRKVDCEARDHNGDTPLHIASRKGYDDIVSVLVPEIPRSNMDIKNYNGQTCLHVAAEGTHLPVIRILASNGANVNARDSKSGRTILHYAAESGNMILLEYVLQLPRVNVNEENYAGLTAITLARGKGYLDIVSKLETFGASLDSSSDLSPDTDSEG